ncbi:hypothetical protein [Methylobacterium sp. J-092]|nr:hypothetical protein [Methylobacterium sp. J-092]MCJ2008351.1 hypothetical protein [Methylobacterium sp. J-092]
MPLFPVSTTAALAVTMIAKHVAFGVPLRTAPMARAKERAAGGPEPFSA